MTNSILLIFGIVVFLFVPDAYGQTTECPSDIDPENIVVFNGKCMTLDEAAEMGFIVERDKTPIPFLIFIGIIIGIGIVIYFWKIKK